MATTKAASDESVELEALKASKVTSPRRPGRPKGSLNRPKPPSLEAVEPTPKDAKAPVVVNEVGVTLAASREPDGTVPPIAGNDNDRRSMSTFFKPQCKSRKANPETVGSEGEENV